LPRERLSQDFDRAELDPGVGGQRARLEEAVGRRAPPEVPADGDLAWVVGRSPGESDARLEVRTAAPLGGVRLGIEKALDRTRRGRGDRDLLGETEWVALLELHGDRRQPQPQVPGTREVRKPHRRERAGAPFCHEWRLL